MTRSTKRPLSECRRLASLVAMVTIATAAWASPADAGGYYTEDGRYVRYPDRYLLTKQRRVRPRPKEVTIEVPVTLVTPPPPPPPVVVRVRDPYDTDGIVVTGAGIGGLIIRADDRTTISPSYRLHVGLAIGASEFALRLDLAPRALALDDPAGKGDDDNLLSLFAPRASFDYRFLPGAFVHPVAGAGLEAIIASPSRGETATAFAATARVGMELAFPLSNGALALGLDTTGHLPFARAEAFPLELSAMLSFGAYLDYRF